MSAREDDPGLDTDSSTGMMGRQKGLLVTPRREGAGWKAAPNSGFGNGNFMSTGQTRQAQGRVP